MTDATDGDAPSDADVAALLADLHAHLHATAALPVSTDASRWLGEAEAVAADVAERSASRAAIERRVDQVDDLLSNVERTGDRDADEHVAAARTLVERLHRALETDRR